MKWNLTELFAAVRSISFACDTEFLRLRLGLMPSRA